MWWDFGHKKLAARGIYRLGEGGFDQEEGSQAHVCKSMEEALEQEARETRAIDIKNLMEEMKLSAEQAMKALRIPQDEHATYARLIE